VKPSLLELQNYFVTALSFTANQNYDGQKQKAPCSNDLLVEPLFQMQGKDARHWQATLKITYRPGPDVNAPYHFSIEIVGLFRVGDQVAEEKARWFIETNGTAVLYSTAREILRAVMSRGPYPSLILPTGTFYEPEKKEAALPPEKPAQVPGRVSQGG
jgi:preprotein translocase subunit SecB